MAEPLRVVYYGGFDPRSGIKNIIKKYALYFDEMYVVNSFKLLGLYAKDYEQFDEYHIVREQCKEIMGELKEFSKATNFLIQFYDPLEIADRKLWEQVTKITENDLNDPELKRTAISLFKHEHLVTGMVTGTNIALANSLKLRSAPATNENSLDDLMLRKITLLLDKFKQRDVSFADEHARFMYSKYRLVNLYGFKIFDKLPLPVGDISEGRIADLRHNRNFRRFRINFRKRVENCIGRATDLLDLEKRVIPEERNKLKEELKRYQKITEGKIPEMRSDLIRTAAKGSIAVGVLSSLAFGWPIGLVTFLAYGSGDLFMYYIDKRRILKEYSPCCTFLFNLGGTGTPKTQKRYQTIAPLPKLKLRENYGLLASTAALYFMDER